jgi:hypothetical protein
MSFLFEFFPEDPEVIDLSIVRDPNAPVPVAHRLSTRGGQINDAEPLMTKANAKISILTDHLSFVVGPPVSQGISHRPQDPRVDARLQREITVNPTHGLATFPSAGPVLRAHSKAEKFH